MEPEHPASGLHIVRDSELQCPECRGGMVVLHSDGVKDLEIDYCSGCHGVWFDHEEWDHLESLRHWEEHQRQSSRPTTWGEWLFQLLARLPVEFNVTPRRFPIVTLAIVGGCVLVHILVSSGLVPALGNLALRTSRATQWDHLSHLLTYPLLHTTWLHLVANMYFLCILGDNVEDALGRWGYSGLFVACGAAAGLLQSVATQQDVPLVGASGAIAGVMAAYFVLFPRARLTFMLVIWQVRVPAAVWLGVWVILQAGSAYADPEGLHSNVAWVAHLMGFLAGLVLVLPLRRQIVRRHPLLHLLETRRLGNR